MNYKTILLCAGMGLSLHTMQGMNEGLIAANCEGVQRYFYKRSVLSFKAEIEQICRKENLVLYEIPEFKAIAPKIADFVQAAAAMRRGLRPHEEVQAYAEKIAPLKKEFEEALSDYCANQNKKHWFFTALKECENNKND